MYGQVGAVINEELPDTADAIRLSGLEFSDAMEEIGQFSTDVTGGLRDSARALGSASSAATSAATTSISTIQQTVIPSIKQNMRRVHGVKTKIGSGLRRVQKDVVDAAMEEQQNLEDEDDKENYGDGEKELEDDFHDSVLNSASIESVTDDRSEDNGSEENVTANELAPHDNKVKMAARSAVRSVRTVKQGIKFVRKSVIAARTAKRTVDAVNWIRRRRARIMQPRTREDNEGDIFNEVDSAYEDDSTYDDKDVKDQSTDAVNFYNNGNGTADHSNAINEENYVDENRMF